MSKELNISPTAVRINLLGMFIVNLTLGAYCAHYVIEILSPIILGSLISMTMWQSIICGIFLGPLMIMVAIVLAILL
jgi:hypothetical protein